ncbi:hypothetical protein [Flavobacterium sp. CF136]|uniref:hypothetical protein n=1 Tax=Flavobacterium sp. (strain CF136) TaxID=1144313 RepID=UPI0002D29E7F|nr:hypothetical protein [Flavobacterium sp. CF136]
MCTYIRNKRNFIWLVYALKKNSQKVVSFNVGKRTNKTLSCVLDTLKLSEPKKIFTDRLKNYRYLIDEKRVRLYVNSIKYGPHKLFLVQGHT